MIQQNRLNSYFQDITSQKEQQKKTPQNTHSFQVHMERSLGLTTYQGTKQDSTNLRVQKLSQASFLTTMA